MAFKKIGKAGRVERVYFRVLRSGGRANRRGGPCHTGKACELCPAAVPYRVEQVVRFRGRDVGEVCKRSPTCRQKAKERARAGETW